jgi:hypothetical protein
MTSVTLAYGSALSRIDDMKLLGGVSGGRTGREILSCCSEDERDRVVVLTNPWIPEHKLENYEHVTRHNFRTWDQYRDLLYASCDSGPPDIIICAVAVSNYTPTYVVQTGVTHPSEEPVASSPCVKGKVDSRLYSRLLVELEKTPNILGGVRNRVGRDPVLVGFKLTSSGDERYMLECAQMVLEEAECDLVIANDLKLGLGRKWAVTPTGSFEIRTGNIMPLAERILACKQSGFYRSIVRNEVEPQHRDIENVTLGVSSAYRTAATLWERLGDLMKPHGCLAVRIKGGGFVTTTRGKRGEHVGVRYTSGLSGNGVLTAVWGMNHDGRTVLVGRGEFSQEKATLNAPLLDRLFAREPNHRVLIHLHRQIKGAPTVPYVPPGTVAEANLADQAHYPADPPESEDADPTVRDLLDPMTLNIEGHGSVACFQTTGVEEIVAWVEDKEKWAP